MTSQEILSVISGVRLTYEGKSDFTKYRFKAPIRDNIHYSWLPDIVRNENDVRLLAMALAWNGVYHYNLDKQQCIELLYDWVYRYQKPSSVLKDVVIETPTDLKNLIRENSAASFLLNGLVQKKIHPVTFCYLDKITNCSKKWNSVYWKMYKNKYETVTKIVDLPHERVLQLSSFLIKHFKEHEYDQKATVSESSI